MKTTTTMILFLLFTSLCIADIIRVPQDVSTIQAALDSCSAGDTVLVSPGTYHENITWPNTSSICLMSECGRDTTIIDGGNTARVIELMSISDSTTVIKGFTIRNGYSSTDGGGIYCFLSSPIIMNNLIDSNEAAVYGGGICLQAAHPRITGNIFIANSSGSSNPAGGGGIYCDASSPFIDSNIFSNNQGYTGGGIYCKSSSSPTISNNEFTNNTVTNSGGAISCNIYSSPLIWKNVIDSNYASQEGGGIACFRNSNPEIRENTILNNEGGSYGGAIDTYYGSSPRIVHNIIQYNNATNGGGISCWDDSTTIIDSNCIMYNTGSYGGGINTGEKGTPIISCNNIVGNSHFGVFNSDPLDIINAENNWWGAASGPYHPVTNPTGQGDTVGNYIDYTPYLSDSVVGIKKLQQVIPDNFVLYQNYPNPFNASTVIRFSIPKISDVRLVIYDMLGREISTLVNQRLRTGSYEVNWNASGFSSGIYFYRLTANEYTEIKKMVFIK